MKRVALIILTVMLTAALAACTAVEYLPAELTQEDGAVVPQASPAADPAPVAKAQKPEVRVKDGVTQWRVGDGEWHDVASIDELREQYPELFAPEPVVTPVPTPKPSKKPSSGKSSSSSSDSSDDYVDYGGGGTGGGGGGGGETTPSGPSSGDGTDMVL